MPELPEVERATEVIREVAVGKRIGEVEIIEDKIVFSEGAHSAFAQEITGRKVIGVGRYGKCFFIELDGEGRMPVLHFGMTGMLQVKGEFPMYYRSPPKSISKIWPPRFYKFILHLVDDNMRETTQLAFLDARRLGRIRLRASPTTEPPISELGFDPVLTMPSFEEFCTAVRKRTCPIKALLLDQSFSAGVGNWVADEILYNAQIHPEHCNTLSSERLTTLHHHISEVCRIAVAVNADDSKFPNHWLFKHRWGKGKKEHTLRLPSGEPATIKWIKIGGRTSAYVEELQVLPSNQIDAPNKRATRDQITKTRRSKVVSDNEDDLTPPSDCSESHILDTSPTKKRKL